MSVELMGRVWRMNEFDSPTEKLILLCFADFANDDGECWPKIATVAFKSNCSEDHVRHVVKKFEELAYLAVLRGRGRGINSRYKLFPESPDYEFEKDVKKVAAKRGFKKNLLSKTPFSEPEKVAAKTPFSCHPHIEPKLDNPQEPSEEIEQSENRAPIQPRISVSKSHSKPTVEPVAENDFRPFESDTDNRFETPHFFAVCKACDIDLDLVSLKLKRQAAAVAVSLKAKGFTVGQIELVRRRWPFETAPNPTQLQDRFVALLNQKDKSEIQNGSHSKPKFASTYQTASERKRDKWELEYAELTKPIGE